MKTLYTAIVTVHGGREGHARSSDEMLEVDLMSPEELGRPGSIGTNPEQLFAAGYGACFESALRLCARKQKIPLRDASITAHVSLNLTDEKRYILGIELHGKLDGVSPSDSMTLMEAAHKICPYSNSTRGNVDVQLFVDP